jgi:hypothetical protein
VLTVRDPHSWYASARKTIFARPDEAGAPVLPDPSTLSADTLRFVDFMLNGLLPRALADGEGGRLDEVGEDRAVAAFEAHNRAVQAAVPADRLLVYRVGQGWEPLCAFLGVDVPAGEFPHANDSGSFQQTFTDAFNQRPNLRKT